MSNKVDKLFKEKLGEHSLPPSAQAWVKIEANLSKKNKGIIWFRIAAVLALLGLLTFVWMRNDRETVPQQMATERPVETEKGKTVHQKVEKPSLAHQQVEEKKDKTVSKKKKQNNIIEQALIPTKTNNELPAVALVEEQKTEPMITNEVAVAKAAPQKSIKLTFSLPTLNEEVPLQETVAAAEPEEKKNTIQKAVNDIRTGDVFGSLRDAKNDLFAWNFKKDKTKSQH